MNKHISGEYDVLIVGGGIIGTSLLYTLANYTNIASIGLVEKRDDIGLGVSNREQNSQTLHMGDIETNYDEGKVRKVKEAAGYLVSFVESHADQRLYRPTQKMVLAVGADEVARLEERYRWLKDIFPEVRLLHREGLREIEPKVVLGRDENTPLYAIYNPTGHIVDFGASARCFVDEARKSRADIAFHFGHKIGKVGRASDGMYELTCEYTGNVLRSRVVVFAVGAASLRFAHEYGYRREWILLPVAGSFFRTRGVVKGKVYMMQIEGIPFAAVHADPSFSNENETHFGPLAKVLPMLERGNYESVRDFFKLFRVRRDAFFSLLKILSQKIYLLYILKQILYDLPFVGRRQFLKEARKIIPTLSLSDIYSAMKKGGVRPQIVNTRTGKMQLGEARISGDNLIFDITPSPGASVSLDNARKGAHTVAGFLGPDIHFDEEKFRKDHS